MNEALSSLEWIKNGDLSTEKIKSLQDLAGNEQFEEQVENFCSEEIHELLENNQDLSQDEYNILVTLHINNDDFLKDFINVNNPKELTQNDIENYNLLTNNQEVINDQMENIESDENFLWKKEFVKSLIMLDCLDEDSIWNILQLYERLVNDEKVVWIYKQVYKHFPNVPDNIIWNLRTRIQEKEKDINQDQLEWNLENGINQEESEREEKRKSINESKENVDESKENIDESKENVDENRENVDESKEDENKNKEVIKNRINLLNKQSQTLQSQNSQFQWPEFEAQKAKMKRKLQNSSKIEKLGLDINQLASIGATQMILSGLSRTEKNNLAWSIDIDNFQSEAESLFGDLEVTFKETFDDISQNSKALDTVVDKKYNTAKLDKLVDKFGEGNKQKLKKFVNSMDQQINSSILKSISNSLWSMSDDIEIQDNSLESDEETFLSTSIDIDGHQDQIKFQRDGDIHLNKFVTQGVNVKRETDSIIRFENDSFNFQGLGNMNEFRDGIWEKIMSMDSIDELESIDIQKLDKNGLGDVDDLTKDALEHSLKSQGLQSKMMEFYPDDIDIDSFNEWNSIQDQNLSEYMEIVIYSSNRASIREIQKAKDSFDRLNKLKDTILEQDLKDESIDQAAEILNDDENSLVNWLKDKKFNFVRVDEKGDRYIDFDEFDDFVDQVEQKTNRNDMSL